MLQRTTKTEQAAMQDTQAFNTIKRSTCIKLPLTDLYQVLNEQVQVPEVHEYQYLRFKYHYLRFKYKYQYLSFKYHYLRFKYQYLRFKYKYQYLRFKYKYLRFKYK